MTKTTEHDARGKQRKRPRRATKAEIDAASMLFCRVDAEDERTIVWRFEMGGTNSVPSDEQDATKREDD